MRASAKTWRRTAAGAALVMALSACGGADSTAVDNRDTLSPRAAIAAAVQQSEKVSSSRFSLTSTTAFNGQTVEFGAEGAFDYASTSGELTFTLPGNGGELRQRVLGDSLYLELPNEPGVFYELKLSDLVDTSLAGASDPTAGLKALEGVSDDVTEVGSEQVRGEQTTHYRGTLDVRKSLDAVQGPLRAVLDQALAGSDVQDVPFDAYIDDEGRLRRLDQTLTIDNPAKQGESVEITTQLELYDFGVDVSVEKPPAGMIRDGAPILEAFKAGPGA